MKIEGVYFEYSSIQMSSCYQTVEVHMPFSPHIFHSMGIRPIVPPEMEKISKKYAVRNEEGEVLTTWYPNREVIQHFPDETVKIWYEKPTLSDAVNTCKQNSNFIQFHKGGVVTAVIKREGIPLSYYWSVDMVAVPVNGPFETGYHSESEGWIFESDIVDDEVDEYDSYYYRYGPR